MTWYADAHAFAWELAVEFNIGTDIAAGIIAALSPACDWEINKRQSREMLQVYAAGKSRRYFIGSTYPPQIRKAWAIRELQDHRADYAEDCVKDAIDSLLGPTAWKTRAFFDNILRPDTSRAVTIDRHILVALDCDRRYSRGPAYAEVAGVIRKAAGQRRIKPHQLQAIIWTTYKHLSGGGQTEELPF